MSRSVSRAVLVTLLVLAAGCAEGTAPLQPEGVYQLQSVNDQPLPYTWTYPATSSSYTLRSQRITVRAGATWESASSHRYVYPGLIRDETNSLDGGTYTFDAASGALVLGSTNSETVLVGTVSGRRLTIMKEGDRLTYER